MESLGRFEQRSGKYPHRTEKRVSIEHSPKEPSYNPAVKDLPSKRAVQTIRRWIGPAVKDVAFQFFRLLPRRLGLSFLKSLRRFGGESNPVAWLIARGSDQVYRKLIIESLEKSGVPFFPNKDRYAMYGYVLQKHIAEPVDFLEFGVHRGASIEWWLSNLSSNSKLFGFDSFEGLPEDFRYNAPKGTFDLGGQPPPLRAPNLKFVKGWFEKTLTPFLNATPLRPGLVIHLDADLYSSTIYVLRTLKDKTVPGTIVIFDEYWDLVNEFAALEQFITETQKQFEYVAITAQQAAIRFK